MSRDDDKTNRQIARSKQRRAGDRSADLARKLMQVPAHVIAKLEIDDDVREAIDRARAVTSHIARRRAERTLAGDLRRFEIGDVEAALAKVEETGGDDVRQFHLAEHWRAKLIEEGIAAAETFPAKTDAELSRLVDAAQRERTTGRPPGAARALFRHIVALLKTSNENDTSST